MKLVWMVLFALPLMILPACGEEDDLEGDNGAVVNMKDYSDLLDKKRSEVFDRMDVDVYATDEEGIYYLDVDKNVLGVSVLYTFGEENEYGAPVTYEKSVMVDVILDGFNYDTVYNFVTDKYGKGQMIEDILVIKKGDMYVWYTWNDEYDWAEISYVNKKEWDKLYGELTKGFDMAAAIRATKAKAKAHTNF